LIKRKQRFLAQLTLVCDVLVLASSYFVSYWVLAIARPGSLQELSNYLWVVAMIGPFWVVALWRSGLYSFRAYRSSRTIIASLLKAQLLGGGMLLSGMFLSRSEDVSRLLLQVFIVFSGMALATERLLLQLALRYRARHLRRTSAWRVLLVADRLRAAKYRELLRDHPYWVADIAGVIDPAQLESYHNGNGKSSNNGNACHDTSVAKQWAKILNEYMVDEVLVVGSYQQTLAMAALEQASAERGLTYRILGELPRPSIGRYDVEDLGDGRFIISLEVVPFSVPLLLVKRTIDVLSSIVGLTCCAIVYPLYALWVNCVSPGPVLFRQRRVGRNGRIFVIYKFRTMNPDAEQKMQHLLDQNQMSGPLFKIKSDPRIFPGGRLMRATHLDELPQFFNVLRGDMSLVGTRPPTPAEAALYENHHYRRLSMRPGITGLWQVRGNGFIKDFEQVVKLDCDYIDNWSLWLDAKLILKTCAEVLKAAGW
jgi:exopolysaccharide biosynthesis polyprenyl glycosylphosphotransferase